MSSFNSKFADAVQRAREIAAKIHSGVETTGTKRSIEEVGATLGLPEAKKLAVVDESKNIALQLQALQAQRALGAGMANSISAEDWRVPDKMVGLIIGRGGEQITRLQAESGCKVQMAHDSGGLPDRNCTLTGTRQAIEKAKELMSAIINRGGPPPPTIDNHMLDGQSCVEMLIPGPKVGLIIGKGGETIRNLQERAAVKMVLIQDGPQQSSSEKPLRITGEPDKCEYAKQLVMDLLTEKELENLSRSGFDGTNEYGSKAGIPRGGNSHEVMVPKQAVGVVIGKGGDMIKKIQQDSGARVQFLNVKEDGPNDKVCLVTGTPDQIQMASNFINELIQSVRDQQSTGRGRGRGRPDGNGPNFNGNRRPDLPEIHYAVPANKCGLVIGKGGETIKNINQMSGAHVTLSSATPPNVLEKVFVIKGQPPEIEHAKDLINERIGGMGNVIQSSNPQNNPNFQPQFQPQQSFHQGGPTPQAYAPQGWGNAYQPWQQGQQGQPTDPNAAAWAAYYQYYNQQAQQMQQPNQPGMQPGIASMPGHLQQQEQSTAAAPQPPAATPASASSAAPVGSAVAQQPTDYSAAWAEYYRSLGMTREAEMIETQARAQMGGAAAAQAQPASTNTPASAPAAVQPPPPTQPPGLSAQPPAAGTQPQAPTGVPAPPQQAPGQWSSVPFGQAFAGQQQQFPFGFQFGQQNFAAAAPQ